MKTIPNNRTVPNTFEIKHFLECKRCAESCPVGMSLQEWADIQVGLTAYGLQVWCVRHKCNVFHVDFRGQRMAVNATAAGGMIWPVTQ
jgi:hypothetical protein